MTAAHDASVLAAACVEMCAAGVELEDFATQYFAAAGPSEAVSRAVLEELRAMPSSQDVERARTRIDALGRAIFVTWSPPAGRS